MKFPSKWWLLPDKFRCIYRDKTLLTYFLSFSLAAMQRAVIIPYTFNDVLSLPAGLYVNFPSLQHSLDPDVFWSDADTVKRWIKRRQGFDTSKFQFASTSDDWLNWGRWTSRLSRTVHGRREDQAHSDLPDHQLRDQVFRGSHEPPGRWAQKPFHNVQDDHVDCVQGGGRLKEEGQKTWNNLPRLSLHDPGVIFGRRHRIGEC